MRMASGQLQEIDKQEPYEKICSGNIQARLIHLIDPLNRNMNIMAFRNSETSIDQCFLTFIWKEVLSYGF
jgi:hypothetical protein